MTADLAIYFGVMIAGVVSFLSPCVLPLVPPYLAYIGGTTIENMSKEGSLDDRTWRRVVIASLFFVAGLSTVFISLGAGASMLGQALQSWKGVLSQVAGVFIILFGLHFLGVFRISAFYSEWRMHREATENMGYGGAYLMGLAFAFGWTPCIGPILGTVLSLAANEQSLGAGVRLLAVYSLGLSIPFVLAAIAIRPFLGFMQRFRRHLGTVEKVMGAALVITGILFLTGSINWLGQWLLENVPFLAELEEWAAPKGLGTEILKKGAGQ